MLHYVCFSVKMVAAGAAEVVNAALVAHAADAAVVFQGCRAIHTLALALCASRVSCGRDHSRRAKVQRPAPPWPLQTRGCTSTSSRAAQLCRLTAISLFLESMDFGFRELDKRACVYMCNL